MTRKLPALDISRLETATQTARGSTRTETQAANEEFGHDHFKTKMV